jgi:hypothetical protein
MAVRSIVVAQGFASRVQEEIRQRFALDIGRATLST